MLIKIDKKAFTFVEIIVVTIILSILATIGFSSFSWHISSWRDTLRKSNIAEISWAMKTYKQKKGSLPIPSNYFKTQTWTTVLDWQGKLDKNIGLSEIDEIPLDPKLEIPYLYSITPNKQDFQIALTLENWDWESPLALLKWSYKSIAKNILPTLLLATGSTTDIDISSWNNKNLFIFNNQSHNLPYDFEWNLEPISDWVLTLTWLIEEAEQNWVFSQNSSFETCLEIRKAGKSLWDWEYQIRSNTWALTNTWCTWM